MLRIQRSAHTLVAAAVVALAAPLLVAGPAAAERAPASERVPASPRSGSAMSVAGASPASVPGPTDPAPASTFNVLAFNDFHGRLEAADPAAGAAVLAGAVRSFEARGETLVVSAGDLIGASTFTSFIQEDQPTLDAFNSIGLDASALGNHEFDTGTTDLRDRILPAAEFPYLAANVYTADTTNPAFDEYSLHTVGQVGVGQNPAAQTTVGFIGAVTEELPSLVSPAGIADIEVGEIVPAVNRVAQQLSDGDVANGEADVLILLVHEGAASPDLTASTDESAFGRVVTGVDASVDAIVSAHTHQTYTHEVPVPGTDRTRPVLQAGQYGQALGHLTVSVDAAGDLVDIGAEMLPLFGAYPPDAAVEAIVADAVAVADVEGAVPVGRITADLTRAVQSDRTTENRGGESTLGNFVADVQQAATADVGSQFALMNPGGLRADLRYLSTSPEDPDGTVTYREAASVQPFANTLVTLSLTGAQLRQVLEEQWQPAGASRPFLKLGASQQLRYSYDPGAPAGEHIGTILLEGEPVADGDVVRATVNSFLAAGGDNFTTLAQGTDRTDSGRVDLQSLVGYFATAGEVSPDPAQRAVGVSLTPSGPYRGGETLTVGLSSLLFSTDEPSDEPAGETVVVSVDAGEDDDGDGDGDSQSDGDGNRNGQSDGDGDSPEPATAPIDPTIVDTTDETGRATVTLQLPDALAVDASLSVAVPGTGTSLTIPLAVEEPAEPIGVVSPPAIHGAARVGKDLTAAEAQFAVENPSLYYQWTRNGEPIEGAVSVTYRVQPADAGADIAVVVTASAPGRADAVAGSAAKTVRRLGSETNASADRLFLPMADAANYTIRVTGDNDVVPVGDVVIYDGGWEIASATLTEADEGEITVTLPAMERGVHLLTARFVGDDQLRASTSWPAAMVRY
jgi:5'-nucleotidase